MNDTRLSLADGSHTLVHDPNDGDWSVWRATGPGREQVLVGWHGGTPDDFSDMAIEQHPVQSQRTGADPLYARVDRYRITEAQYNALWMWCKHVGDPALDGGERWYAYAERLASTLEPVTTKPQTRQVT